MFTLLSNNFINTVNGFAFILMRIGKIKKTLKALNVNFLDIRLLKRLRLFIHVI